MARTLGATLLVLGGSLGMTLAPSRALAAVDTTPPTTTITLNPGSANGSNGWYKTSVLVKVSAVDNSGGSGVNETRCVLDPATPPTSFDDLPPGCAYSGAGLSVATDGPHSFYAGSLDKAPAGNKDFKVRQFKLDATPPTDVSLSVTAGTPGHNGWYTSNVTIHASGSETTSNPLTCTVDQFQTAETAGRVFNGNCTNAAGLKTNAAPLTVKLDKTPPEVSVQASPGELWPPDHKLRDATATVSVSDRISGAAGFVLTSATSSEADDGLGDGDEPGDIQGFDAGTPDTAGQLRAERSGGAAERTYRLLYTGVDNAGNSASASATATVAHSNATPRRPAMLGGAQRVIALQRTQPGWEGTWYWYVGNTLDVTNLTGVTALGLLEAYRDSHDASFLDAARLAAGFSMAHLGSGATGAKYFVRMTSLDIILLHLLGQVTGDASYATRATLEWENIKTFWPTAAALDANFRTINRRLGAWDLADFLNAAILSGDRAWADGAAAILANVANPFYYDAANPWYPMTVAGALRALAAHGYADAHPTAVRALLDMQLGLIAADNVEGGIQTTAYAAMALRAVGGPARNHALALAGWLASAQGVGPGWIEADGKEYAEIDGEAVRALADTAGGNLSLPGYVPGPALSPGWRSVASPGRAQAY